MLRIYFVYLPDFAFRIRSLSLTILTVGSYELGGLFIFSYDTTIANSQNSAAYWYQQGVVACELTPAARQAIMGWAENISSLDSKVADSAVAGLDMPEGTANESAAVSGNSLSHSATTAASSGGEQGVSPARASEGHTAEVQAELPVGATTTTSQSPHRPQSLYDPLPPACFAQFPTEAILVSLSTQIERHFGFKVDRLLQESASGSSPEAQATLPAEPISAPKHTSLSKRSSRLRPRIKCSFNGVVSSLNPSPSSNVMSSTSSPAVTTAGADETELASTHENMGEDTVHKSSSSSSKSKSNGSSNKENGGSSTSRDNIVTAPRSCRIYIVVHAGSRAGNFLKLKNSYPLDSYTKMHNSTKGNGSTPVSGAAEHNTSGSPSGPGKAGATGKVGEEVALGLPSWSAVLTWSDTPCMSNINPLYVKQGSSQGNSSAAGVESAAGTVPVAEAGFWVAVLDVAPATAVHFGAVEVFEFESASEGSDLNSDTALDSECGGSSVVNDASAETNASSSQVLRSSGTEQTQLVPSVNDLEEAIRSGHSDGDAPILVKAAAARESASNHAEFITKSGLDSSEIGLVEAIASAADSTIVVEDRTEDAPAEESTAAASTPPTSRAEPASVLRRVTVERGKDRKNHPTYDVVVTTVEAGESRQDGGETGESFHGLLPSVKCVQRRRRGLRFQVFRELNQVLESTAAVSTADKSTSQQFPSKSGKNPFSSSSPLHEERSRSTSSSIDLISSMKGLYDKKSTSAADQQAATSDDSYLGRNSQHANEEVSDASAIKVAPMEFPKNFLKSVFGVQLTRAEIEERRRCLDEWLGSVEAHAASLSSAEAKMYEAFLTGADGV